MVLFLAFVSSQALPERRRPLAVLVELQVDPVQQRQQGDAEHHGQDPVADLRPWPGVVIKDGVGTHRFTAIRLASQPKA